MDNQTLEIKVQELEKALEQHADVIELLVKRYEEIVSVIAANGLTVPCKPDLKMKDNFLSADVM